MQLLVIQFKIKIFHTGFMLSKSHCPVPLFSLTYDSRTQNAKEWRNTIPERRVLYYYSSPVHTKPAPCIFAHATILSHPKTHSQSCLILQDSKLLPFPRTSHFWGYISGLLQVQFQIEIPHEKVFFNIRRITNTIRQILFIPWYFLHIS